MFPKLTDNPFDTIAHWLDEASTLDLRDPNAMCLSTCTKEGVPSSRMVLLKHVDADGFVFYTNYTSQKSKEILGNPHVALNFYWEQIGKQLRVTGIAEKVSSDESNAYFATRDRKSRIGAWASHQSAPLEGGMKTLLADVAKTTAKFTIGDIPRPEHWGGWRIKPLTIEFWQQGEFRIHQRLYFVRKTLESDWKAELLYP